MSGLNNPTINDITVGVVICLLVYWRLSLFTMTLHCMLSTCGADNLFSFHTEESENIYWPRVHRIWMPRAAPWCRCQRCPSLSALVPASFCTIQTHTHKLNQYKHNTENNNKLLCGETMCPNMTAAVWLGHIAGAATWQMLMMHNQQPLYCHFSHIDQWVQLPAWGFLLVSCSNNSRKMSYGQNTDIQMDCSNTWSPHPYHNWGIITTVLKNVGSCTDIHISMPAADLITTHNHITALWILSRKIWVSRYQK